MPGYRFLFLRVAFALGALVLCSSRARAETTLTVLGLASDGAPNDVVQQITDNLRLRAGSTPGIVPVEGKDLIEMKLVFDCESETPQCIAQAGRSLGADKVLYGTIKKLPGKMGGFLAELKLLDVRTANVEHTVSEHLVKNELTLATAVSLGGHWFSALVDVEAKPSLIVMSDPADAALTIDGTPAGRTPTTLRDLSPGVHTITLSMNGHAPVTRSVELKPGNSMEIVVPLPRTVHVAPPPVAPPHVALAPTAPVEPPLVPRSTSAHPGRTAIIVGSTLLAAGLVCGIVNGVAYNSYHSLEGDIGSGKIKKPSTAYDNAISDGNASATLATGMAVAWPVLAVAGGTALGIGIYQYRSAHQQNAWILPVASPTSLGVAGGFHF